MTWLEKLLHATREAESPRQYFYWAGLATISAVVKNNLYLDRFYYKLYPNIFVLLIGRSGLRKGVPIALSSSLVKEVNNTRLIQGKTSIQRVLHKLATGYTLESGEVISDSIGFLKASEFGSFIIQDPSALVTLTDLYDGHYNPDWEYSTHKHGEQQLKNVCLTMLAASNEPHFHDVVKSKDVEGGFIARTFIVYADKKANVNSLTERPTDIVDVAEASKYLKELSRLRGTFEWTKEGKEAYDLWYDEISKAELKDDTGTLDRIGDSALKAAMLLSLSRSTDLKLALADIEEAIDQCKELSVGTRRLTTGQGKAQLASQTRLVLMALLAAPENKITRQKLLQKFWGQFDSIDLDRMQENLVQAGLIKVSQPEKGNIWLILKEHVVKEYNRQKEEK